MDLYTKAKWEVAKRIAAAKTRRVNQELQAYPMVLAINKNRLLVGRHNLKISP